MKADAYKTVRIKKELIKEWAVAIDKCVANGMPVPRRSRNWEAAEAFRLALSYVNGLAPTAKLEPDLVDLMNARINFKVAQMIEALCADLDLEFTPRVRPDGHLELRIGDRGSFILPTKHYTDQAKLAEEDELAEFVTLGKPN